MPSGRTHDSITLWMLPWIVGLSALITRNGELTLIIAGGFLFSGLMFGPDLDIYSVQYQRWGKIRWIWLPYQKLLRHRSLFSHGFILGTVFRVCYLLSLLVLPAIIGVAIAQLCFGFDWNWQKFSLDVLYFTRYKYPSQALALFVGLELGAMSHSLSDWFGSAYKRWRVKKNNRRKPLSKSKKKIARK